MLALLLLRCLTRSPSLAYVGLVQVTFNYASLFGGGLALGPGGQDGTCSLSFSGPASEISLNSAGYDGCQVYFTCLADLFFANTTMRFTNSSYTQVMYRWQLRS